MQHLLHLFATNTVILNRAYDKEFTGYKEMVYEPGDTFLDGFQVKFKAMLDAGADTIHNGLQLTYNGRKELFDIHIHEGPEITGKVTYDTRDTNTYSGNGGNNYAFGVRGADTMKGKAGDDILDGGDGNDRLVGGAGSDHYVGGTGRDSFYTGPGQDTIYDFQEGVDRIYNTAHGDKPLTLEDMEANSTRQGDDTFVNIGGGFILDDFLF